MSAARHLRQPWRSAWQLLLLGRRVTQLAALVEQTEQAMSRTHDDLACLRMELARQRYHLRFATDQRTARQPTTW